MSGLCRECVCIESFDEYDVPFVKLLVVTDDAGFNPRKLLMFLSDRLEAYKVPRKIETVDAVEKTFNGKIDRKVYRSKR